jgi:formate dehydrogenase maturation protein FdhE
MKIGTMFLFGLLVVVAIATPEDELAKEMTHAYVGTENKNLKTIVIATIAMAIAFVCGFICGVMWAKRESAGDAKVLVYPKGKRYHCATCTSTPTTSNAKAVTITSAQEQRMTPCKCSACEKAWTLAHII